MTLRKTELKEQIYLFLAELFFIQYNILCFFMDFFLIDYEKLESSTKTQKRVK